MTKPAKKPPAMSAEQLITLRKRSKLTQAELAACMGRAERSVRRWEAGKDRIPRSTARFIIVIHAMGLTKAKIDALLSSMLPAC